MSSVEYTEAETGIETDDSQRKSSQESMDRTRVVPRITIQAFCENEQTAEAISNASADRRLAKSHVTVQMGGARAANSFYQSAPTPNLIIIS